MDLQVPTKRKTAADKIIFAYKEILSLPPENLPEIGKTIPIPTFEIPILLEIAKRAEVHFASQNSLLRVKPPLYIIGDIHGNLFDLIRLLVMAGVPPISKFLFLGDYVDRGHYSIEVLALLFSLSINYPDHVYILRGNHEFENVNCVYGFRKEVQDQIGDMTVYDAFNHCFEYISIVAQVGSSIFAVHGGISSQVTTFQQIESFTKPIGNIENHVCSDLLWSDPTIETADYARSIRGFGMNFGVKAVQEFVKTFNIKHVIRAHQCVLKGIEKFADGFLYTVFSCSNYSDMKNYCGLIFINENEDIEAFSLPPV